MNNNEEEENCKYKLNFDFIIPKESSTSFQSIFSYIRKKYQIKFCRKSQIDSLLKKCKGKFFKTIHDIMNRCMTIVVKRLPQFFITNISIEYNKKYFDKTVIQIYQEFNNFPEYKSQRFRNELNDVNIQEGKRIGLLYEFVALNFSAYYKYSKPHHSKNKES